ICTVPTNSLHEQQQQNFSRYLNSHCGLSSLQSIRQYRLSRILDITLNISGRIMHILCRMWGSGSNILLTDDRYKIIECLRRYPKRSEWPDELIELSEITVGRTDYPIRDIFQNVTNINEIVHHYFRNEIIKVKVDRLRRAVTTNAAAECDSLKKTLSNLTKSADGYERYLKYGELIKNYAYSIKNYCEQVVLTDYNTNEQITIPMNPKFTVQQNMQAYFDKYKKAAEAARLAEDRKTMLRIKYDEIRLILTEAENTDKLNILTKLRDRLNIILGKQNRKAGETTFGRKFILADGTAAFVSKNAKDADQLLKRVAKGNDYWFHIRDYAGSHVIVKNNKSGTIDPKAKIQAAHLALYFSQLRTDSNLDAITDGDVYFTQIKYLRKPNTNTPGLVFPTQEKNIKVIFDKAIITEVLATRQ
ncbi:MAG: DUF814 domain-containing protein, partial [Spirochaetales bacterium]|nr:DUF814 domain-containing protein [Spirochaetales bacterium]